MGSPAQKLRIAIAIVALRHKPADQSYESYVLDLRARFPLERPPEERNEWRERALALERDMQELRKKYEDEHIELAALRTSHSLSQVPIATQPEPLLNGKKKQKKKATLKPADPTPSVTAKLNPERLWDVTDTSSRLPDLFGSTRLLPAFQTLETLIYGRSNSHCLAIDGVLGPATERAMDACVAVLKAILPPESASTSSVAALDALSTLLPNLLTAVLPLLIPTSHRKMSSKTCASHQLIDDLLGRLTLSILIPLVGSFAPSSSAHLDGLFQTGNQDKERHSGLSRAPKEVVDVRPHVFTLLQKVMGALEDVGSACGPVIGKHLHTVHECLIIEAIRELEKLYPDTCSQGTKLGHDSHADRGSLVKLARKDSLWYLCSCLHLILSPAFPSGTSASLEQGSVLGKAIDTRLSQLLRRTQFAAACQAVGSSEAALDDPNRGQRESTQREEMMGEVERGMILAVMEKAWFGNR